MASDDSPEDRSRRQGGDDGVVRPSELDYTESERVARLQDGRYVVATDRDGAPRVDNEGVAAESAEKRSLEERGRLANRQMARYVSDAETSHGIAVTAAFEGEVSQRECFSDDIATAFGDVVRWYTDRVDADVPPARVLGILLLASDTDVAFPTKVLAPILRSHGLTTDDTIGDLVEALGDDGLRIPPPDR
jgi:hypothetical protein